MSIEIEYSAPTDLEIANGINGAIADLNKYLGMAKDGGLRVDIDYSTSGSIGPRYDLKFYSAEILRPVRPS